MKVRHKVRAVLLDGDHLVFLRRGWPGGIPYWTTVGGSVEPDDADLEAALRREVMEEIGATIGPAAEFLTVTEPGETANVRTATVRTANVSTNGVRTTTVIQHYFLADLLDMDPERRHGPELDAPDTGDFEPVRVALHAPAVAALDLQPSELADHVLEHLKTWKAR
jgi:8-oxo-dGTP pyrophosphatase MutT (NUDIX family)